MATENRAMVYCQSHAMYTHTCAIYAVTVKAGFHFGEFGRATKQWLSGHAQLEIQAESERLLANAWSVLEVE